MSIFTEDDALHRCSAALAQRRPAEAERIAREVLATSPQHPAALFFLGVAHLVQGRAAEAVKPLEQAARLHPDASVETHLAMALRECGRAAEALTWFERATARSPAFAPLRWIILPWGTRPKAVIEIITGPGVETVSPPSSGH